MPWGRAIPRSRGGWAPRWRRGVSPRGRRTGRWGEAGLAGPAARIIEARQALGRDAEPIEHVHHDPAPENRHGAATGEFARRRDERRAFDADGPAGAPQAPDEVVIPQQRKGREAADPPADGAGDA